jgi:hypothetical protein
LSITRSTVVDDIDTQQNRRSAYDLRWLELFA